MGGGGKEQGRLGLGRIREMNLALLGKWLWRLRQIKGGCGIPSFSVDMGITKLGGIAIGTFLNLIPFVGSTLPR